MEKLGFQENVKNVCKNKKNFVGTQNVDVYVNVNHVNVDEMMNMSMDTRQYFA